MMFGNSYLPEDFQPGCHDFVIGRGRAVKNHSGNIWFRKLIATVADEYSSQAGSKEEKSEILTKILNEVAAKSGWIVKQDPTSKRYYAVSKA